MSHRLRFRNRAELNRAYARLLDQSWVESCTVDVPRLAMRIHAAETPHQRARAEAWLERQRDGGGQGPG